VKNIKKSNCGNCDNCLTKKVVKIYNFAEDADKLFNVMNLTGNCYGSTILIAILRGANSKKIKPRFKKSPLYNSGNNHSEKWWKIFR
jgi:superfamily II DNA helicase RecQ